MSAKVVLVVEDSPDTQILYREALKMENYEVATASDGVEALAWLEKNRAPDVLLLDLTLPKMTGAEFMKMLRARPEWSRIQVLVISGQVNLQAKATEIGADACLRKPFDLSVLYREVGRMAALAESPGLSAGPG